MCQLSYVNFNDKDLNIQFTVAASFMGAREGPHKDGFGFRYGNQVWKSVHPAHRLLDFGWALGRNITDNSGIMSHIRWGNKPAIAQEFSHPFAGNRLIFAHNGTLTLKEGEMPKDITDSQFFLSELEKELGNKNTFIKSIQKVMERFYGKFAFLIWDTKTNTQYICRGKTAELHILTYLGQLGKPIGYAINTNPITLTDALIITKNGYEAYNDVYLDFGNSTHLLDEDSIYIARKDHIEKKDVLVENPAPPKPVVEVVKAGMGTIFQRNQVSTEKIPANIDKVADFMNRHGLLPSDMDTIFNRVMGVPILGMTEELLDYFVRYAIPILSASKKKRKNHLAISWKQTVNKQSYIDLQLPYPWMLLDDAGLRKLYGK